MEKTADATLVTGSPEFWLAPQTAGQWRACSSAMVSRSSFGQAMHRDNMLTANWTGCPDEWRVASGNADQGSAKDRPITDTDAAGAGTGADLLHAHHRCCCSCGTGRICIATKQQFSRQSLAAAFEPFVRRDAELLQVSHKLARSANVCCARRQPRPLHTASLCTTACAPQPAGTRAVLREHLNRLVLVSVLTAGSALSFLILGCILWHRWPRAGGAETPRLLGGRDGSCDEGLVDQSKTLLSASSTLAPAHCRRTLSNCDSNFTLSPRAFGAAA
eukprot:scaffold22107_cov135-Isochrysis_galbana.AAC.3